MLIVSFRTVVGFQANDSGPHKAIEYWLSLREDPVWMCIKGGLIHVEYNTPGNLDIIDLRTRTVTKFNVSSRLISSPF